MRVQRHLFNFDRLTAQDVTSINDVSANNLSSYDAECERFKKKFACVVLLTECLERFLLDKVYECIFPRVTDVLYRNDKHSTSLLRHVLDHFPISNTFTATKRPEKSWLFFPLYPKTTGVPAKDPKTAIKLEELKDTTAFGRAKERLRARYAESLDNIISQQSSHKKTIDLILRRLQRLPSVTVKANSLLRDWKESVFFLFCRGR